MFTCQAIKNGSTYLGRHLRANDYYDKGNEVTGRWLGEGARELGIEGKGIGARDKAFEALRRNRDPRTGETLTARTASNRRAFFDFQISAPKDVSILAVTFGDQRLRAAHEAAVLAGFAELERLAARQGMNRGAAGREPPVMTGNLVTAAFTHDASRELDAQLHTHLVCGNATFDRKTQTWYALENAEMFAAVNLAGRVYQAELARRVRALGYEIVEERNERGRIQGFNIAGVTEDDRRLQSTRRQQIEAEIAKFTRERGRPPTAGERHVMATETRGKKLSEVTTEEVRRRQLGKYSDQARRRLEELVARARASGPLPARPADHQLMIEWAAEHIFERRAVASEKDLIVTALQENLGAADVGKLREALRGSSRIVGLGGPPAGKAAEQAPVSSAANLALEREAIALVNRACGRFAALAQVEGLPPGLKDDQRDALEIVAKSTDGVVGLRGPAGAGKTTALRALDKALRETGQNPLYVSPQHAGRRALEAERFSGARTISQFLLDLENRRTTLKERVLIVDEAGLLSARQGHSLLKAALGGGGRVVLVGDEKQMPSVEAGDFLAMLRGHSALKVAELKQIRRQRDPKYRAAMQLMSEGRVFSGLEILEREGNIKEGGAAYLPAAAEAYLKKTKAGETAMLVAPTWAEVDDLNRAVRKGLRSRGDLTGPDEMLAAVRNVDLTGAQRSHGRHYQTGQYVSSATNAAGLRRGEWHEIAAVESDDRIRLKDGRTIDLKKHGKRIQLGEMRQLPVAAGDRLLLLGNDKRVGVSNGMFVTVKEVGGDKLIVQVEGPAPAKEIALPATYRTIEYGHAVTVHKSQGATVQHVVVAASKVDGRGMYVATSRGRRTLELHVPDQAEMARGIRNDIKPRASAVDYAGARAPASRQQERLLRRVAIASREFYRDRVRPTLDRLRDTARRGMRSRGRI